jgi:hypothetical protein
MDVLDEPGGIVELVERLTGEPPASRGSLI